jgi:hypothetical protein
MARADDVLMQIASSLEHLGARLDKVERRERARRDELQRRREAHERADAFADAAQRQASFAGEQALYDPIFRMYGAVCPPPGAYESKNDYRLRVTAWLQGRLNPNDQRELVVSDTGARARICDLASFPLSRCDDASVARIICNQIRRAAEALAFDNASVPEGETKQRRRTNGTGHDVIEWIGTRSFCKDLNTENRLATITDPVALATYNRVRF